MGSPKLPPVVKIVHDKEFDRTKLYDDGSYAKLITQVAMTFAEERGVNIDKKQIEADVKDLLNFEKKLNRVSFFIYHICYAEASVFTK